MDTEKFSLEEKLEELRILVEKMQKGISDFDQQVALYKEGSKLIHTCREYLNGAELEIKQLIDGELKPFDEDGGIN